MKGLKINRTFQKMRKQFWLLVNLAAAKKEIRKTKNAEEAGRADGVPCF